MQSPAVDCKAGSKLESLIISLNSQAVTSKILYKFSKGLWRISTSADILKSWSLHQNRECFPGGLLVMEVDNQVFQEIPREATSEGTGEKVLLSGFSLNFAALRTPGQVVKSPCLDSWKIQMSSSKYFRMGGG